MTEIELTFIEDFANAVIILDLKPIFVESNEVYDLVFAFDGDRIYSCQVEAGSDWRKNLHGHVVLNAFFPVLPK